MATNKFELAPLGNTVALVGFDSDGFMKSEETRTFVRTNKVKRGDGIIVTLNEADGEITIGLTTETVTLINNSKIVDDLKALAFKETIRIQDIEATGDRNSQTFLAGDGTFRLPAGGGDMLKSIYDPEDVSADAFSMGNMRETEDAKIYSGTDKTKLQEIQAQATKNQTDAYLLNRQNHTGTQSISATSGLQAALDAKFSPSNPPTTAQVDGLPGFISSTETRVSSLEDDVIKKTLQTLTTPEKLQARMNIDAFAIPTGAQTDYIRGDGTVAPLTKATIDLANVNNTSDANKPVSTATQTALNLKFDKTGGFLTANSQIIADYAPQTSWAEKGTFYARGLPGSFAGMHTLSGAFTTNTVQQNNVYTPSFKMEYANFNGTNYFTGSYALGTLKFLDGQNPGQFVIAHVDSAGGNQRQWTFDGGSGNFVSPGTIQGSAKNFVIDHPADPFNFDLVHASTEAPELLVEYRGHVKLKNGKATVNVEDWYKVKKDTFVKLWTDAMVHGLQNQDTFDRVKPSAVRGATFDIISENEKSDAVIAWHLIARRNDPLVRWSGFDTTDDDGKLIIEKEKEE